MTTWRILIGDVRARITEIPDASVQCVVTSPPYFGLRDYGTATWDGGDPACAHKGTPKPRQDTSGTTKRFSDTRGEQPGKSASGRHVREQCKCGARRIDAQVGLEESPFDYIAALVAIFEDVKRVLRDDGTLWLNLGDSYASTSTYNAPRSSSGEFGRVESSRQPNAGIPKGLKSKDLIGVPWRVAFALQDAGWYLRSGAPWVKRNVMPESIKDRPGTAIEHVFLLTKHERYFYDPVAVMKPGAVPAGTRAAKGSNVRSELKDVNGRPPEYWEYTGTRNRRNSDWFFESWQGLLGDDDGQPLAFVVNTKPYNEAHFAVFPESLVAPCVLAGTSEHGQCPRCGAPWERVTERVDQGHDGSVYGERAMAAAGGALSGGTAKSTLGSSNGKLTGQSVSIGWEPTCACGAGDPVPQTVLDPFAGSGTTGAVAVRHRRHFVGCELKPEYAELARQRIGAVAPLFAAEVAS